MRAKLLFSAASAAVLLAGFAPAAFAQDQPGDASSQARFTPGQALNGEISPAGDVDWFRMSATQGQRYNITLNGVTREDGSALDPMLGIYDAQGNQLAFNDDADGLNAALRFAPSTSGGVFVEVRAFSEEATGAYQLAATAESLPADAVGNDASTRARIMPGRPVAGTIDYEGDVDSYRLDARRNQRYNITLASAGDASPLADPYLVVTDGEGVELASNDDADGLNSALDFIPRGNGPVYVQAHALGDAGTGAYTLNVTAAALPNDGVAGDRSTRGRVALGQELTGSLDFPSDADWYRIRLTAGESYRFALNSSGDNAVSDPLLRVYNASGEEVAMDDDGGDGLNSYLEFTAPTTGSYYVAATAFGDAATGGYTLSARAGDIPSDTSTDVRLSVDGDYRDGMLSPAGDRDWYRVEMDEGDAMRIGVTSSGATPLGDPFVVVHGPDGAELAMDDDGGDGLNSYLEFQAASAGAYFVEVRGFSEDAEGSYSITITGGEIGASFDSADMLVPGPEGRVSIIGAPDDVDWFAVELIEGRPYRFSLDGAEPDPLADPYLRLYDSEGNEVASDDDGGPGLNAYLTYTSATGGTYFVAASSFANSGAGRYFLRAADTDVPGNVYTDENLATDGEDSRISRIDIAGDLDNYRVSLEAGVRYVIDVRGYGDNPLRDPYLTLLNSANERIASDDDSGDGPDARLRFTPADSGEYFIQASGLGGSTGDYQVSIVRQ
jgi:hypothetical protein